MTIDEALVHDGLLIAAWDESSVGEAWLGIYSAGDAGVKLLAFERMPEATRAKRTAEVSKRAAIGTTSGGEFVWATIGDELAVWNLRGKIATVKKDGSTTRVTSFVDENNLGHRGVRLERKSGGPRMLVDEHDPTPELDPTYDRSNVAIDAAWASALGKDLARWLGVPHTDQI
jgi:hypothetical protein